MGGTMNKRRLVLAVLAGALLAVAIAVPSLAAYAGKAAEGGSVRFYHYTAVETDTAPVPQYVAVGASKVRLNYDTKVDPYSLSWTLAATGLQPGAEYALVNVRWAYEDPSIGEPSIGAFWLVDELGRRTANARGMLTMKGSTDTLGSTLYPYRDESLTDEGYYGDKYGFDTSWFRFPGAEVWLVPTADVKTDDGSGAGWEEPFTYVPRYDQNGSAVNPDWWLAALGLPVDTTDVDALTYSREHPLEAPEAAPLSLDGPGAAQRATGD